LKEFLASRAEPKSLLFIRKARIAKPPEIAGGRYDRTALTGATCDIDGGQQFVAA